MRRIIHKFVNVYPYIAYSCKVAIHIIISWILGSGRDYMESGIVTSYKNKGIIIPKLISLPFFLRSSNICLKNCFFRQIFLKSIYFSSCQIPENQESASLMVTNKVMSYTDYTMTPCRQKVFSATYICIWSTMYNHYANSHICCLWLEKHPVSFLGTKGTETHPSFVIRWWYMYHHSCCQWHKEDLSNSWIKDTRWTVMNILGYWFKGGRRGRPPPPAVPVQKNFWKNAPFASVFFFF